MMRALLARIPQDKRDHALVGLVLFAFSSPLAGPFAAFLFVFVMAAVWELYQFGTGRGVADLKDAAATAAIPAASTLLSALAGGIF